MLEKYHGLKLAKEVAEGRRDREEYYWGDFVKSLREYLHDAGEEIGYELDALLEWAIENARWEFDILELMEIVVKINKHWLLEKAIAVAVTNAWPSAFIAAVEGMAAGKIDPREYVREVLKHASSARQNNRKS